MNFLTNLTTKKALLIFLGASILNFSILGTIYYFLQLPKEVTEYQKIASFTIDKFMEKNINFKVTKSGLELNQDPILIETKGFPIELKPENLIVISKSANYADFKEKSTIAILNDKELVLNLNNEYQNLPIESLLGQQEEVSLNPEIVKNFITTNYLENNNIQNFLLIGFSIDRLVSYLTQLFWSYIILGFAIFYLFKFSSYEINKQLPRNLSLLFYSLVLMIEPLISLTSFGVNFIYVFIAGFLIISLVIKRMLDKELI